MFPHLVHILSLLLILQALCAIVSDNDNNHNVVNVKYTVETSRILTDSSPPRKYLLIIPGFGGRPSRAEALRHTMTFYPSEDWDCLLFVYKSINITLPCEHIDSPGFFAQHMLLVRPEFIVRRKYQMVVVHVDDVVFLPSFEFSWSALLKFMLATGVDSASPRVNRAGLWRLMDPRDNATKLATSCPGLFKNETTCDWNGYDVPQLEIFVQAFTPLTWICFWDTLDTTINTDGWGYDVCFKTVCNASIALIDNWHALHTQSEGDFEIGRGSTAMAQMVALFKSREYTGKQTRDKFTKACPWPAMDYSAPP